MLGRDLGSVASHGIGVAASFLVLTIGQRCLGDERAQPRVVGLRGERVELLVDDSQLLALAAQALGDLAEAALDLGSGHAWECTGRYPLAGGILDPAQSLPCPLLAPQHRRRA